MTKQELKDLGVNVDNLTYPNGEMNIIVQCFGYDSEAEFNEIKDDSDYMGICPDIYQPRKNSVWSCGCQGDGIDFIEEDDKKDYVHHLRDSVERLKILSILLSKQADEIEEFGFPKTSAYYPEPKD